MQTPATNFPTKGPRSKRRNSCIFQVVASLHTKACYYWHYTYTGSDRACLALRMCKLFQWKLFYFISLIGHKNYRLQGERSMRLVHANRKTRPMQGTTPKKLTVHLVGYSMQVYCSIGTLRPPPTSSCYWMQRMVETPWSLLSRWSMHGCWKFGIYILIICCRKLAVVSTS
jgi:hypothetical protein